jgi:surface antigen
MQARTNSFLTAPLVTVMTLALAAALLMTAGSTPARADSNCSNTNTGGVLGGIAGAALGGFLGSQFGSGGGKTAATIGGVVLGGIAGNQLGKELTCEDEEYVEDTTYESLESGEDAAWRNTESGNYGEVRPGDVYTDARGYECRAFEQEIYVNGQPVKDTGTACKQPDGSWQIVS